MDLSDLIDRERLDDRARARVEHGSGHGRHARRRQLHSVTGLHAAVEELNTELRVVLMDRVDQFLEGRNAAVVIERQRHLARCGCRDYRGSADRHQARAGFGPLNIVGNHFRRRLRIAIEHHAGRHAGHHDPVLNLHPADRHRREQSCEMTHAGIRL